MEHTNCEVQMKQDKVLKRFNRKRQKIPIVKQKEINHLKNNRQTKVISCTNYDAYRMKNVCNTSHLSIASSCYMKTLEIQRRRRKTSKIKNRKNEVLNKRLDNDIKKNVSKRELKYYLKLELKNTINRSLQYKKLSCISISKNRNTKMKLSVNSCNSESIKCNKSDFVTTHKHYTSAKQSSMINTNNCLLKKTYRNQIIKKLPENLSGKNLNSSVGINDSKSSIDRLALKNMEESIKSFLVEKAPGIRSMVNETASIFEGEGENSEQVGLLETQFSHHSLKENVFLQTLFENVENMKIGWLKEQSEFCTAPVPCRLYQNAHEMIEENTTFESTGQRNILFSDIRVSQEFSFKKRGHKRMKKHKTKCSMKTTHCEFSQPENRIIKREENNDDVKLCNTKAINKDCSKSEENQTPKNHFLNCQTFESYGENRNTDCRGILSAIKKYKPKSRKRRMSETENYSPCLAGKHHTKFTLCRHRCMNRCLKHENKKNDEVIECDFESKQVLENRSKSIQPLPVGSLKSGGSTKQLTGSYDNEGQVTLSTPQIFHCYGYTPHKMFNSLFNRPNVEGLGSQFCIPDRGSVLLLNSDPSSSERNQDRDIGPRKYSKPSIPLNVTSCNKSSLCRSKSLNAYGNSESSNQSTPLSSKKQMYPSSCGQSSSEPNVTNRSSLKEASSQSSISVKGRHKNNETQNTPNANGFQKEEIYECYSGTCDYIEIKRYIQIKTKFSNEAIITVPEESVNCYILDTSRIENTLSVESLKEKKKRFDSLYQGIDNFPNGSKEKDISNTNQNKQNILLANENTYNGGNLLLTNAKKITTTCASDEKITHHKSELSIKHPQKPPDVPNSCNVQLQAPQKSVTIKCASKTDKVTDKNESHFFLPSKKCISTRASICPQMLRTSVHQNGTFLTAKDLEKMKIKFQNNFSHSSVSPTESSEGIKKPTKAIWKALMSGKTKMFNIFCAIRCQ